MTVGTRGGSPFNRLEDRTGRVEETDEFRGAIGQVVRMNAGEELEKWKTGMGLNTVRTVERTEYPCRKEEDWYRIEHRTDGGKS